jgi:hypothetical protein
MDKIKKTPYCLMPWIHFHLGSKGQVNACCVSTIKYGNINNTSISDLWQNKAINDVRQHFLTGKTDQRCKVCINRELAGAKSLRQETNEKFQHIDIASQTGPIYFDIRFSNVCNFKCRTCWHGASSKWFEDAKKLKINLGQKAIIKNILDFEKFISQNGAHLLNAQEIYFAGGEPLVTEEHYLILQYLIKHNITKIKLRYNTNFSILKFKGHDILDYWSKFEKVEILASIDESKELGEYIRKELKWQTFLDNRKKIEHLKHVSFKISPTASVFNIATLPEFFKLCLDENIINTSDIYINILDRPLHYSCKVLSPKLKTKITNDYKNFFKWCHQKGIPKHVIRQFEDALNFMNKDNYHDKYWSLFLEETTKLDFIRSENISHLKTRFL